MEELHRLGARSVPVVSRGDRYVFAQIIGDVTEFLGIDEESGPELGPEQLAARYDRILETAIRLVRQMPDGSLENELPDRPRSWRVLMHHVFQIPTAFLDLEEHGPPYEYENLIAPPPEDMRDSAAIAAFGDEVRNRFAAWWEDARDSDFGAGTETYFGATSRHELLERTVWHTAQHVRQITALLEQAGVAPDRPLGADDIAGLPLTDTIWN